MIMPVDYHQRYAATHVPAVLTLLADVHAPARQWAIEHPQFQADTMADMCFTVGYLTATIASLLDALGYPEHGPSVDQHSWLPGVICPECDVYPVELDDVLCSECAHLRDDDNARRQWNKDHGIPRRETQAGM